MTVTLCVLDTYIFLVREIKQNANKDLVLAAVFIGLSLLVRTNLLFFLPVIAIVIGINKRWSPALLYLGVTVLVVAPYCIRNSINNHAFFPFDGKPALTVCLFNSYFRTGHFSTLSLNLRH